MIIMCTNNNNNAVINGNLWKTPRPYFALQNSQGQAKGFRRSLWTIWAIALKIFASPGLGHSQSVRGCQCHFLSSLLGALLPI